jgi:hypothetical protein
MEQGLVYGRDLYEDRVLRWVDRLYLICFALTLGIPFLIGYWIGGVDRGVEAFLWGGFVRIFLYQHATFSVTQSATSGAARTTSHATRRGTTGSSRCSSSARAGTTTTTPFRLRRGTACTAINSTSRGGSSAASRRSGSSGTSTFPTMPKRHAAGSNRTRVNPAGYGRTASTAPRAINRAHRPRSLTGSNTPKPM